MEKEKLPKGMASIAWILVLGAILPMLDSTIVNIAVNDLAKVFSSTFAVTQWVVTGYVLATVFLKSALYFLPVFLFTIWTQPFYT